MKAGMALVLCGAAVIAVLWATAAPRAPFRTPAVAEPPSQTEAERVADEVGQQAERLRTHLQNAPAPRPSSRNPFRFAEPSPPSPQQKPARAPVPSSAAQKPRPPVVMPLRLIGVAEHATSDGVERTAIISSDDQLFMVKTGQTVAARYVVTAVGADAVELRDVKTAAVRRLRLP